MMKYRIAKYCLGIIILTLNLSFSQEISFENSYPSTSVSVGVDVIENKYGEYLIAGATTPHSTYVLVMKVDGKGNLIWEKNLRTGNARSIANAGVNNWILVGSAPSNEDILIVKTNILGDYLWSKIISKPYAIFGSKIINTYDGGYAIIGWTLENPRDVLLIKTDNNCDPLWTKTFGDYVTEIGYDIRELPDKGFIIAGTSYGGSDPNKFSSAYIIRTDSIGDPIWSKRHSINGDTDCRGIIAGSGPNDFIFAGTTRYRDTGLIELFLYKIDHQGDSLWLKTYEAGSISLIYSMQETSDGGYIMSGRNGIFKTDVDGNFLWVKYIIGMGKSVKETSDGGYIITGKNNPEHDVILIKTRKNGMVSVDNERTIPSEYALFQNFPNPFNPSTTIRFENNSPGRITVDVYNIAGKKIETIYDKHTHVGLHKINFDGKDLSSGVYFYRISSKNFTKTKKMILLK